MDDDIRAQTIVVLTSGNGLEHALIIRRNKANRITPHDEKGSLAHRLHIINPVY